MGQCSTLPAGPAGRGAAPSPPGSAAPDQQPPSARYESSNHMGYEHHPQGNPPARQVHQPRQRRDDSPTSGMNHSRFARKGHLHTVADQHMSDAEGAHASSEVSTALLRASAQRYDTTANMNSFISVARQSNNAFEPFVGSEAAPSGDVSHPQTHQPEPTHPQINKVDSRTVTPSPKSSGRRQHHASNSTTTTAEETNEEEAIPQPPESAVRMRCYRLNLEHPFDVHGPNYGPLTYEPPAHHRPRISSSASNISRRKTNDSWNSPPALQMSDSDDSSDSNKSATAVAIATAKIFRGLTIDKNGVITSQNPRASRSNRNKGNKQGEKSRQAAKIDKANDLAEEAVRSGPKEDEGEISNMISLVIVGEYDDMKYLVKDGSKRLREAEGMPDEALLGMNRIRQPFQNTSSPALGGNHPLGGSGRDILRYGTPNSSRDDVTPAYQHGQYGIRPATPTSPTRKRLSPFPSPGTNNSPYSPGKPRHRSPQSAPPKLKSHPRDQSRSRRRLVVEETDVNRPPEAAQSTRVVVDENKPYSPRPTNNVEYPRGRSANPSERAERPSPPRFIPVRDQCHDIFGGDGDWGEALGLSRGLRSLWDCGATGGNGTMSPTNPSVPSSKNPGSGGAEGGGGSPEDEAAYVPEARNESNFVERGGYDQGRGGGASSGRVNERSSAADVLERVEAPGDRREGNQDVLMAI